MSQIPAARTRGARRCSLGETPSSPATVCPTINTPWVVTPQTDVLRSENKLYILTRVKAASRLPFLSADTVSVCWVEFINEHLSSTMGS